MPYLAARRTEEWQGEQTSVETFPGATGESGASAFLIVCSPWQSVQTGASTFPFAIALPWTLVAKVWATFSWQRPHVAGMWNFSVFASVTYPFAISWAPWQSMQVAAFAFPFRS